MKDDPLDAARGCANGLLAGCALWAIIAAGSILLGARCGLW